jgi:hypothetical protein
MDLFFRLFYDIEDFVVNTPSSRRRGPTRPPVKWSPSKHVVKKETGVVKEKKIRKIKKHGKHNDHGHGGHDGYDGYGYDGYDDYDDYDDYIGNYPYYNPYHYPYNDYPYNDYPYNDYPQIAIQYPLSIDNKAINREINKQSITHTKATNEQSIELNNQPSIIIAESNNISYKMIIIINIILMLIGLVLIKN